jgi:abequosyltransferase
MIKKEYKLSICIATYNRAEFISETLDSILCQINSKVEIVIVDGASTDDTEKVISKYCEEYECINYYLLEKKGGVDYDYNKAVEFANGEMCWLFTDDDLLIPGAISTVLQEVSRGYSLIVVNSEICSKDFSKVLTQKIMQINTKKEFLEHEFDSLFQTTIPYLSFIGGVVINRNLWLSREKQKYFGTEFIHVGVIFQDYLPAPVLVIAEPLISIRLGNASWTARNFEIWIFKWPNLLSSFEKISEQFRKEYIDKHSWRRFKNIMIVHAQNSYSIIEYKKWFKNEDTPIYWKFMILILSLLPSYFSKTVIKSYLRIVNKNALDLMNP